MKKFWILILLPVLFESCASYPLKTGGEDMEKESFLKYPVILVHGIIAHDRKSIIDFWGNIPETLIANGVKIYFGNTDAWGSFESNAKLLKETIDNVLLETNSEKVNIIAHSKGGLDSRFFIWNYDYGDKVASLSTVSTPHHGAEIADLIFQKKIVHTKSTRKALENYGKMHGDINPDLYNVNYQLTTEKMKEFNEKVLADDKVFYQSIYSTMKNAFDDMMLFNSYLYIKKISGANDGIVSEISARWSGNITKYDNISHIEMMDLKKRKISGIYIPDIFMNIVKDLQKMGF